MTPREHVATLLAMTDDFIRTVERAARHIGEDDEQYWVTIQEYGFSEGMWIPTTASEVGPADDADEMYTDDPELMARVDTFITNAREGA